MAKKLTKKQIMAELTRLAKFVKEENATNGVSSNGEGDWTPAMTLKWSTPLRELGNKTGLKVNIVPSEGGFEKIAKIGVGEYFVETM